MDLGGEVRKAIAEQKRGIERDVQQKMNRFASTHKGQQVETIRPELARFWSRTVGGRLSESQLQETAQAIHDGEHVPTHARLR